jgi:hypothetical protein
MLAKLRLAFVLGLALCFPTAAYAAQAQHPGGSRSHHAAGSAHAAKPKPKRAVKKANWKPAKRSAAKGNPNMRASHKSVVKHARPAPKKRATPSQASAPVVGTKV